MEEDKYCPVIIADSQFLFVEALKSLLEDDKRYVLSGVATNHVDLYRLIKTFRCSLLVTDFASFDYKGIDELKKIRHKYPRVSILVLTNSITNIEFIALTRAGIRNVIYKSADKSEVFNALRSTLGGEPFYSDEILDLPAFHLQNRTEPELNQLTTSEFEIVKLIANGLTTRKIATQREISYHTVNTHRRNIFKKTDVSNVNELILHAIRSGWIENVEFSI